MMAIEQEIRAALDSEHPVQALRTLVISVHKDGITKAAIYHKLHWYSQLPDLSEPAHDYLLDVLDLLVGYCAPSKRLVPEEPDVTF